MSDASSYAIANPFGPPEDLIVTFRAMASDITLRVSGPKPSTAAALVRAQRVFESVETSCTRFNPESSLMQANAAADRWAQVAPYCYQGIEAAFAAYQRTGGAFDPRVLRALVAAGYDKTLEFKPLAAAQTAVVGDAKIKPKIKKNKKKAEKKDRQQKSALVSTQPWEPDFNPDRVEVRIGPDPVDLGGIGKGLSVRWAAEELKDAGTAFLVEAGGDCYAGGSGPDSRGWRVAVEDPFGGADPCAVLQITDLACATSSIRIRRWNVGGKTVHHIIDPRTGAPGGAGLQAVTVVGPDPADAEVWSKSLFLAGINGIAELAVQEGLAALWISDENTIGLSPAMEPFVLWQRHDG